MSAIVTGPERRTERRRRWPDFWTQFWIAAQGGLLLTAVVSTPGGSAGEDHLQTLAMIGFGMSIALAWHVARGAHPWRRALGITFAVELVYLTGLEGVSAASGLVPGTSSYAPAATLLGVVFSGIVSAVAAAALAGSIGAGGSALVRKARGVRAS